MANPDPAAVSLFACVQPGDPPVGCGQDRFDDRSAIVL
jgi:hypothetical protein